MSEQIFDRGVVLPLKEAEAKQTEFTPEFFQEQLKTQFESFNGDIRNASELMSGFMKGVMWVYEQKKQKGEVHEKPALHIVDTDKLDDKVKDKLSDVFYTREGHKIIIRKDFLEQYSRHQLDADQQLKRYREVVHDGNIQQWFQLLGVEEADHAIFIPQYGYTKNDAKYSLAKYHANSAEFHALGTRIKYAEEHQFPEKTLRVLRGLQRDAKTVRGRPQEYTKRAA